MSAEAGIVDVAICGGGPVGMTLALALTAAGRSCKLITGRPVAAAPAADKTKAKSDPRTLALSYGCRLVLERIGICDALAVTPILQVQVSQQGGFGRTVLNAADERVPALGYVVALAELEAVLHEACTRRVASLHGSVTAIEGGEHTAAVCYRAGENTGGHMEHIQAQLVAIADGGEATPGSNGERIERDYAQTAIVADVTPAEPHRNRAWERFTRDGPVALLPKGKDYALVWSVAPDMAEHMIAAPDAEFLHRLTFAMGGEGGGKAGRLIAASPRRGFPLGLRYRRDLAGNRTLILGNAAQTLHPVAGQGLNLGLRDVWALTQALQGREDCGSADVLATYAAARRLDRFGTIRFTDLLARVFTVDSNVVRIGRGAALTLFDLLPPARHFLARRMIYGASAWP
jgi:2-octaprenyl-6-methoxyphenol hydroxylase